MMASASSIVFLYNEREIGVLEQKRMSVTGMYIGVFNELSRKRLKTIKVG